MRWVVLTIRLVFAFVVMSGVLIAPEIPVWQVVGGAAYVIGVLRLITTFDDDLDVVDLVLYGISGPDDNPLTPKSIFGRAFVVLVFWFLTIAFGTLLVGIPVVPWPDHRSLGPGYFLVGTLVGAVLYLAAAGWYRKSMRRRYGY